MAWAKIIRAIALVGLGLALGLGGAAGQGTTLQWQCVAPSSTNPAGGYCPVNSTYPLPVVGGTSGGVITSTSTVTTAAPTATTFAQLLASAPSRKGCTIQNTGTTLGY